MKKITAALGCTLLALAPLTHAAGAEDTIKARQAAYRLLAWNTGIIKSNLEGNYDAKKVQTAADTIAAIATSNMGALYAPGTETGTGYHPTKVKPEIFTDGEKVGKIAGDFAAAAKALAAAAQGGDQAAVKTAFGDLGASCKACHDSYRAK